MKKLLYLLFLLPSVAFSQLTVAPAPNNGEIVLTSNSITLYFANPTSAPISMSLSMAQAGFSFGINRCSGKTLAKGQSCYAIISVNESQLSSGSNLAVINNNSAPLVSLSRTKTVIPESSVYTQPSFSFSDFLTQDLIIQNKTLSVKSYNPSLTGADSSKFEITINRCSNVPVSGTCRISLRLKPQQAGTYIASLSEPQVTSSVSLSGTISGSTQGVITPPTESFSVSSSSIDFGSLSSFSTTSSRVLNITNTGNIILAPKIEISSKVKVILNRCSSLPVGGTCSITLALAPTSDMANGQITDQSVSIKKSLIDPSSVFVALIANLNVIAGCPSNQHLEGQVCVLNTRSCSVANGSGSQTWIGSSWSSCQNLSCVADFYADLSGVMCSQITYVPTYSPYAPDIPVLNACDGQVVSSRGLSNCMQLHDNLDVSLSKCSTFSPDMQSSITTPSPAGNVVSTILNGELTYACAIGESLASVSPSIVCQSGIPNYQSLSCDTNTTPTQLVVTKTSVATSQGLQTLPIIISPAPLTTTALGSDSVIYTFSPSAVVSLSVSNTSSVVLDSFSGDCSGQSCSVSMSSNKSVLISLRNSSSRFTLLDLNTAPVYKCMKEDGTDLTSIFGESKTLCENSNKSASWESYTCEEKTEMECYSLQGCSVGMGGGGGMNFQCYDNFDEFSCTVMTSGCMWDGNSCTPGASPNSCTGGTHQACSVQGGYQYALSENQCSQEYLTGISVPSGKTQNGLTDAPRIKEQNGKIIASITEPYESYSGQHINMKIATIDINTYQSFLSSADSVQLNQLEPSLSQDGKTIFSGYSTSPTVTQSIYARDNSGVVSKLYSSSSNLALMNVVGSDRIMAFSGSSVIEIDVNSGVSSNIATIDSYYLWRSKTATRNYFCIRSDATGFRVHAILDDINASPRLIKYSNAECGNDFSNTLQILDYASDKILFTRSSDNKLYTLDGSGIPNLISNNLYNAKKPFVNSLGDILMTLKVTSSGSTDSIYKSSPPYASGSESVLINPNVGSNDDTRFIGEINNKTVFFSRYTNSSSTPWKLYSYDNSSGVITDLIVFDSSGFPQISENIVIERNINQGVELGGKLYYISSSHLWETDGTSLGTKIVDHPEFPFDGYFQGINKVGNKLALVYSDPLKGKEILLFDPSQP